MEEAMNIDRRELILPALAPGLLSVVPMGVSPASRALHSGWRPLEALSGLDDRAFAPYGISS
jgi:hypothetical protein